MLVSASALPTSDSPHLPFSANYFEGFQRYYFLDWKFSRDGPCAFRTENISSHASVCDDKHMRVTELADECLIEIFRRLHPTDRIRSASMVCARFYRLIYSPQIWTELQFNAATVCKDDDHSAAKFLQKVSGCLQKLSIYTDIGYVPGGEQLFQFLPVSVPTLQLLFLPVGVSYEEIVEIDRRMPNLRALFGIAVYADETEPSFLTFIRTSGILRNIRRLTFNRYVPEHQRNTDNLEEFCRARSVERICVDEGVNLHLRNDGKSSTVLENITHLSFVRSFDANFFSRLKNVTFLDLSCDHFEPVALRHLHNLKHLHILDLSEETTHYFDLFAPSQSDREFPRSLVYLLLRNATMIDTSLIQRISQSCPNLRSLSIERCWQRTELDVLFERYLQNFRKLEFLRLYDVELARFLDADVCLPQLRCVVFARRIIFEEEELQLEELQRRRPHLLIYHERPDEYGGILTFKWEDKGTKFNWIEGEYERMVSRELAGDEASCCVGIRAHERRCYS